MSAREELLRVALAQQGRLIAAIESLDSPVVPAPAAPAPRKGKARSRKAPARKAPAAEPFVVVFDGVRYEGATASEARRKANRAANRKARKAPEATGYIDFVGPVTVEDGRTKPVGRKALTQAQRRAWNDKFSLLCRMTGLYDARGVSLYRVAMNRWTEIAAMRDAGSTPEYVLAHVQIGKTWTRKA